MLDDTTDVEREAENGSSGSGLRMFLLIGFSFVAGYFFGKRRGGEPDLREELEDLGRADEGPMEIEIDDTPGSSAEETEHEGDEESEAGDETEED
jgi:hypothetical protein